MKLAQSLARAVSAAALLATAYFSTPLAAGVAPQQQAGQSAAATPMVKKSQLDAWLDTMAEYIVMDVVNPATGRIERLNGKTEVRNYYEAAREILIDFRNYEGRTLSSANPEELLYLFNGTANVSTCGETREQGYSANVRLENGKLVYYAWRWEPVRVANSIEEICPST